MNEQSKNIVKRITKKEKEIIEFLRINTDKVEEDLYCLFNNHCSSLENLRLLADIINSKSPDITFEDLIKSKFITREQLETLKKAIDENQNIIITGEFNTGKTFLLKQLISEYILQSKDVLTMCKKHFELDEYTTSNFYTIDNLNMINLIKLQQYSSNGRLIIDEFRKMDIPSIISVLNFHSRIILTVNSMDWKECLISNCDENAKEILKTTLDNNSFIEVNLERIFKDGIIDTRYVKSVSVIN